jgi:hypothetical protein
MSTPVFIARLNCSSKDGDARFHIIVGVFSTKDLAEESVENFIEGILEMEYPNISVISKLVEEFKLDIPIYADKPNLLDDDIPF